MKSTPLLISSLVTVFTAICPPSAKASQPAQSWFAQQGYVAPLGSRVIACHGYGCVRRAEIAFDQAWLSRAGAALRAGRTSPEAERRVLGELVRQYTALLAATFGGRPDAPRSPPNMSGVHGQMDCLDETANTTSLLLVLQDLGLLAHHRVACPQSRGFFFDGRYPHYSAVIAEKQTGMEWAVDPWSKSPGQRPDILPLERWRQDS